jgi:glycosyltransferase involved in cell wall biosynthesis
MRDTPLVSIIIPCKKIDNYTKECIRYCRRLGYNNYEIIVLPDYPEEKIRDVKIIPTGDATPGKKRNIGVANSKGEFCAFIDSDAYPRKDWLKNSIKYFSDPEIAAIGGPGITPSNDSLMQKASGHVLSSFMVGTLSSRYGAKKAKEADDIHSCNFIARKSIIKKVKWDEKYWPGEDTLMCLGIKGVGKKMLEAPNVVVYHHRRPLFLPHLRQVSQFGLHRGFFAKKFPETSLRLTYLLPSLLVLFLIFGMLTSYFIPFFRIIFLSAVLVYLAFTLIAALLSNDIKLSSYIWIGIILTHLTYGAYFLMGLFKRELRR